MNKIKTQSYERVYETEDSFGEYQTYDKNTYYFLGIPIWFTKTNVQNHSIMEYFKKGFL